MKRLVLFAVFLIVIGCSNFGSKAIVLPDEPILETLNVYRFERGVCFDNENEMILERNVMAIYGYAKKLRDLLIFKNKEESNGPHIW